MPIGDPTAVGWTITLGYLVVAFICFRVARMMRIGNASNQDCIREWNPAFLTGTNRHVIIWFALSVVMLLLGINKQLDLQTPFIRLGREIAVAHGLYGMKREIQVAFVISLATAAVLLIMVFVWLAEGRVGSYWPVILGLGVLMVYVLIRAASFEHVNYFLERWRRIGPIRMKHVTELAGIVIVGVASLMEMKRVAGHSCKMEQKR